MSEDYKVHDVLGKEVVKALARKAMETDGLTGAEIHADIAQQTRHKYHLSACGARLEQLTRDGVLNTTHADGVTRYKLVLDPRKIIPPPVLELDIAKFCAIS